MSTHEKGNEPKTRHRDDANVIAEAMLSLLLKAPAGQVWACNVVDTVSEKPDTKNDVKTFLSKTEENYKQYRASARLPKGYITSSDELVSLFVKTTRGDTASRKGKSLLFMCRIDPGERTHGSWSTVMTLPTLKKYYVNDDDLEDPHEFLLSNSDPTDPMLAKAIDALNTKSNIYRTGARLGGGPSGLFWVSPTADLPRGSNVADQIRDLLGLVQHEKTQPLVEIMMPSQHLKKSGWARPTFADAGLNRRFRIRPDRNGSTRQLDGGYTVNLERLAQKQADINGVPERVVEPMEFDKRLQPKFRFLGTTDKTRGETSRDNDRAFAIRIRRKRSLSRIRTRLQELAE